MLTYNNFEVNVDNFDPNITRPSRLISIMDNRIRFYYRNNFWRWLSRSLKITNFDVNKINIADYFLSVAPNTQIKKIITKLNDDLLTKTYQ